MSLSNTTFKLNTGATIPAIGLGTWQAPRGEVGAAVKEALKDGYTHIDCAAIYENEKEVGEAFASSPDFKREKIFVTSKLWNNFHHPDDVLPALEKTLSDLQLDYLDLYLMHWPVATTKQGTDAREANGHIKRLPGITFNDTWKAMEKLLDTGKVKAIGVANFDIPHLERLLASAKVVPAVNQVELHPLLPQDELLAFNKSQGIHTSAYSPLGRGKDLLTDPTIVKVAKETGMDVGQVVLSWGVNRGTSVLPKSVTPSRIRGNRDLRPLSAAEVDTINKGITTRKRIVDPTGMFGFCIFHGEGTVPEDL